MAKKDAKKVSAPKPAKVAKPKKSSVQFESFSVRAVIPVQAYGNIQPEIVVKAATYEEAVAYVMPKIEALWKQYAERTINGESREFTGPVAVEEKVVAPKAEKVKEESGSSAPAPVTAPASSGVPVQPEGAKPAPVLKAEKAIAAASDSQTALGVQDQIEKSSKIPADWKPYLLDLAVKRRSALK